MEDFFLWEKWFKRKREDSLLGSFSKREMKGSIISWWPWVGVIVPVCWISGPCWDMALPRAKWCAWNSWAQMRCLCHTGWQKCLELLEHSRNFHWVCLSFWVFTNLCCQDDAGGRVWILWTSFNKACVGAQRKTEVISLPNQSASMLQIKRGFVWLGVFCFGLFFFQTLQIPF